MIFSVLFYSEGTHARLDAHTRFQIQPQFHYTGTVRSQISSALSGALERLPFCGILFSSRTLRIVRVVLKKRAHSKSHTLAVSYYFVCARFVNSNLFAPRVIACFRVLKASTLATLSTSPRRSAVFDCPSIRRRTARERAALSTFTQFERGSVLQWSSLAGQPAI